MSHLLALLIYLRVPFLSVYSTKVRPLEDVRLQKTMSQGSPLQSVRQVQAFIYLWLSGKNKMMNTGRQEGKKEHCFT